MSEQINNSSNIFIKTPGPRTISPDLSDIYPLDSTDNWKDMHDDPFATERIRLSVDALKAESGMRVLDVGCHTMKAKEFLPPGVKYTGLDVAIYVPDVIETNLEKPFETEEIMDRVLCLEVLEHLVQPILTLRSIRNCLKDDGIAVVSLPNEASLFHRLSALFGTVDRQAFSLSGKHLHLPNLKQSKDFLSTVFEVEKVIPYVSRGAGTTSKGASTLMRIIPLWVLKLMAKLIPSLFARGFIFVLKNRVSFQSHQESS